MAAQFVSRMDQITLEDTEESGSVASFDYVPPELLSDIFSYCTDPEYYRGKATFARLARVCRRFYPIARKSLYRRLKIYVRPAPPKEEDVHTPGEKEHRRDFEIISLVTTHSDIPKLVKELHLYFEQLPPSSVDALFVAMFARQLPNLTKLWFLDHGKDFWKDPAFVSEAATDDVLRNIMLSLTNYDIRHSLTTLVIPQVHLRSIDTVQLFCGLPNLKIWKGMIAPFRKDHYPAIQSTLHRAWITRFSSHSDLVRSLYVSRDSLRYLNLVLRPENGIVKIMHLEALEELVIMTQITEGGVGPDFANVIGSFGDVKKPALLIKNVFEVIASTQTLGALASVTVHSGLGSILEQHADVLFQYLPGSIVNLALGPCIMPKLPLPVLLKHRHLYPKLSRIYLTPPFSPQQSPASTKPPTSGFGIRDFESGMDGIKIEWINTVQDWKLWLEKGFYPRGSEEEWNGRRNRLSVPEGSFDTCIVV